MFENFSGKPGPSISPVMFGPNIIGEFQEYGLYLQYYDEPTGAFSYGDELGTWIDGQNAGGHHDVFFNAQSVSAIYGASSVVQPASLRGLACIKF